MKERINIVILNWNGLSDTISCLSSVKKSDYSDFLIVLVDNGSQSENLDQLKTWCSLNFSRIIYYSLGQDFEGFSSSDNSLLEEISSDQRLVFIENNENLGFAAGNNVGIKYLLKNQSQYVLLLNNDTIVEKDAISELMMFLTVNDEFVAVTPQIRYFNPDDKIWNCGGRITWYGNRRYFFAGSDVSAVPQKGFSEITFITGCALLFKPQIAGLLTESYFFGEEDFEFSFRQKKMKRKMACCYSSVIFHKVSSSSKKIDTELIGSVYLQYLGRLMTNKKYSALPMFYLKLLIHIFYSMYFLIIKSRINVMRVFRMEIKLLKELRDMEKIDRDYYLTYLHENFAK